MKITCLGNYFSIGGAQMDVVLLTELLRQQGHEAEAWFFARDGDLDTGDTPFKIFADRSPRNPLGFMKMISRFCAACRRLRPDALIGFYPFSNVAGALASVFGLCGVFVASQRNPSNAQSPVFYHLEKWLGCTRAYRANICITQSLADTFYEYPQCYKDKIKIVYNGVPPMSETNALRDECRARFGFLTDAPVIGVLGRLHRQKNIAFIVRCMKDLPDHFLAIAGNGPEHENLKTLVAALGIEERVMFVGELIGEDVTKFYKAIDVFAMPSIYEGFGRTLVEAFATGAPVVCSDLPVLEEVSGGAAITLPLIEDYWVNTFRKICGGQIDTAALAAKGKRRAQDFTLEAMLAGYLEAVEGKVAIAGRTHT